MVSIGTKTASVLQVGGRRANLACLSCIGTAAARGYSRDGQCTRLGAGCGAGRGSRADSGGGGGCRRGRVGCGRVG